MRRWNGWGDDSIDVALSEDALKFFSALIGPGISTKDATLASICSGIPPSRLAPHPLIDIAPETRLRNGIGQSLPDWLKLRYGRVGNLPDGVAFPESNEQVRELLGYTQRHGISVIPYGGGTSVVGHLTLPKGNPPTLIINMLKLSRLLNLDPQSQLATFGAGVNGTDLEAQLRAQGYMLGHFPQSFEYSTLGGWIATRSSGQQSLRYGRIEQLFAGGRVETPSGTLTIPTFPASAAGTDLREMVLGSEGRIGILTEATVRITPLPETESFHTVFFPNWELAETAVRGIVQAKLPLSLLRLSNPTETSSTLIMAGHKKAVGWLERYVGWRGCGYGKCMLMIGTTGQKSTATDALKSALRIAGAQRGVHVGAAIGKGWKQNRFRSVYVRNSLWQHGYVIDTAETAVDWPRVSGMMQAIEQAARSALAGHGEKLHTYTHLSHLYAQGASVYSTFAYRLAGSYEEDLARWRSLKGAVSQAIVAHGGTISHQHGVGTDHAPYLEAEKGTLGIAAMRQLFRHFDPSGMMNPGKLLPEQES